MTSTTPTHVDSSIPEIWAKLTLRDQLRGGFWASKSGGEGSGAAVIRLTDLVSNPGDTINVQVTSYLSGSGVSGDTTALEGSEENLSTTSIKTIPLLHRNAVRGFRRSQKKSILDLRMEGKLRLAEWGQQKMDTVRFEKYTASGTLNGETYLPEFIVAGGGTTGASDVATTDKLDVETIQRAKLEAYNNRAKPLISASDGSELFGMVCHPNAIYDLKRNDEYKDWVREAHVRGEGNPFFRGAVAMVDGVVLFQHNNVPTALDGATSNAVARNVLFGSEAFVEGLDEGVTWNEDTFDYGNEWGFAYGFAFQPRRGLAKNSLIVYTAATAP
jgi:N4-gp56 family major capsid protein